MTNLPLAERVDAALARLGSTQSVAELHGALTGLFCARGRVDKEEWMKAVAREADLGLQQEERDVLGLLHAETERQLNDPLLEFQPVLPAEGEVLQERVAALGEWCQGFLLGLTEGGVKDPEGLPGDAAEVVRDLVNISRAGSYELGDSEEDEEAYAELLEYVRAGVLLLNEELNPRKAPPRGGQTVH
jgi:yecA family protein